jgi:hypothetical protein
MTALALNNFALIRHSQKRDLEARQLLERSLEFLQGSVSPGDPLLGRVYENLAGMCFLNGQRARADSLFREALECLQRLGALHPVYVAALADYAHFLRHTGHKSQARTLETQVRTARTESGEIATAGITVDVGALHPN